MKLARVFSSDKDDLNRNTNPILRSTVSSSSSTQGNMKKDIN